MSKFLSENLVPWHAFVSYLLKGEGRNVPQILAVESYYWSKLQCRHLIPAQNAWAARVYYTTTRPITTQCPRHGGMDDLTNERSYDLQATWVIYAFGLSF